MNQVTPRMRQLAKRIIDHGTRRSPARRATHDVAHLVVSELHPHLSNLMGVAGFRALLLRSLALTGTTRPALRDLTVNTEGNLEGLREVEAKVGPNDFLKSNVALLAQLLTLLTAFVGEELTIRIMRDIWPELALTDLDARNGVA